MTERAARRQSDGARLVELEHQVQKLAEQLERIGQQVALLDQLRGDVGKLKIELEEMVEAGT